MTEMDEATQLNQYIPENSIPHLGLEHRVKPVLNVLDIKSGMIKKYYREEW